MGGRIQAIRDALDRLATPRAILALGWLLFVVYSYPGQMSDDSMWQLVQARHIEPRNDWQPPLMAFLWHLTDLVVAGPFPMLVIQSTGFLLGVHALLRRVMSDRPAAIVAVLVLLSPPSIVVMAVVCKESQMAGFLLAGVGALLSPSRRWRLAGYFFLFMATGIGSNAAAATLPIIVLLFGWGHSLGPWRRLSLGLAVWIGVIAAAFAGNRLLTEKKTPVMTSFDVAQGPGKLIDAPASESQRDAVTAAGETLVLEHPRAFLDHRINVFLAQIESPIRGARRSWAGSVRAFWVAHVLHHRASHGWLQKHWIHGMAAFDRWFGCRVGVYLLVALALLPMCRRGRLAFALLASGILHELGLLLIAPVTDDRYSHWLVVATMVGVITLFVTRLRPATASPGLALQGDPR